MVIVSHRFTISLRKDSPDIFATWQIDLPTASSALVLVFLQSWLLFLLCTWGIALKAADDLRLSTRCGPGASAVKAERFLNSLTESEFQTVRESLLVGFSR